MLKRSQQSILDLEEHIDKRNSEIMMRTQISEQEKTERRTRNLDERIFIVRPWHSWRRHTLLVFIASEFLIGISLLVTDKKSNFILEGCQEKKF